MSFLRKSESHNRANSLSDEILNPVQDDIMTFLRSNNVITY